MIKYKSPILAWLFHMNSAIVGLPRLYLGDGKGAMLNIWKLGFFLFSVALIDKRLPDNIMSIFYFFLESDENIKLLGWIFCFAAFILLLRTAVIDAIWLSHALPAVNGGIKISSLNETVFFKYVRAPGFMTGLLFLIGIGICFTGVGAIAGVPIAIAALANRSSMKKHIAVDYGIIQILLGLVSFSIQMFYFYWIYRLYSYNSF